MGVSYGLSDAGSTVVTVQHTHVGPGLETEETGDMNLENNALQKIQMWLILMHTQGGEHWPRKELEFSFE